MIKPHLILISDLEADTVFFASVAIRLGCPFTQVTDRVTLKTLLNAFPNAVVIWSADFKENLPTKNPKSLLTLSETLRKTISPSRVFALTDQPMSRHPKHFEQAPFFQHQILRRYPEPAVDVVARIMRSVLIPDPLGIKRYFPNELVNSQSLTLKRAKHRGVAVEAVQNFFTKKGIKPRLAARVAQATDELLMNAIFNAPHNPFGNPTRRMMDRSEDFELGKNELVQLEIIVSAQYVGVCVSDQFGALDKDVVMRLMSKDYRGKDYIPKDNERGAGLGIYGIMEMGFSLLFVVKPGVRTDAMIFFPVTGNYKNFREGFQFIGYFGGPTFKRLPMADETGESARGPR